MKLKKAVFKKSLDQENLKTELQTITSSLFNYAVIKNEEKLDYTRLDADKLFRILQLNYKNVRAMNCFILYDITDNKLRLQISKYLLKKGCQRIQKSVFLANITKQIYNEIFSTFQELEPVYNIKDSIFMVPIGEYHLAEMRMVGKDVDMSFSKAKEYALYF